MTAFLVTLCFGVAPAVQGDLEALRVDRAVLARLIDLELTADDLEAIELKAQDSTVRLRWGDGVELTRPVELPDGTPAARARALALLLGELHRAKPAPKPIPPLPPSETPAPGPPPSPALPPSPVEPRRSFFAGAGLRAYPSFSSVLFGVHGGAIFPLSIVWLRIAPAVAVGRAEHELGAIWLTHAALSLGAELEAQSPTLSFAVGPRVELGWMFVNGAPRDGAVGAAQSSFSAAAAVAGAMRMVAIGGVRLFAEVELGWALRGLVASVDGVRVAGMAGPLAGVSLGLLAP